MVEKEDEKIINENDNEQKRIDLQKEVLNDVLHGKHDYKGINDILTENKTNKKKRVVERKNTSYRYTKMSNFVLQLSRFYALMPLWKLGLITAFFSVLYGIAGIFLVKNPGIYNFGLAAFGQAVSRLTMTILRNNPNITPTIYNVIDHSLFWFLYLVLSIPIFIFGWKKLGKVYTILTIEFLVLSSAISLLLGQIPNINNFTLFGKFGHPRISQDIKDALIASGWNKGNINSVINLLPLSWADGGNTIVQIIFAVIYGILLAYFFAIIAIIGGSAGVTGIIGEYMSVYKQKSFGTINGYINIVIILISVAIGTYIPSSLIAQDFNNLGAEFANNQVVKDIADSRWKTDLFFSPNFISTLICNFIFVIYLNGLFPRFKIVQFKVYTHRLDEIKESIVTDKKTINSFTIQKGEGGYSGKKLEIISSITLYRQIPRLIKKVREVDDEALITINDISSIDGKIYIPEHKF
ncbi:DUF2179 domain-containing protein [Mycoplasma tauri]|uniref:DUF2179 domain-containing protein n=1 Tax=Mycoplasma tauri TaxID=547987 RepID=A0A953NE25_9MOLU|nr:DUF2179 domain-containing protein [Mycoplasma tauri]MBZ4195213.1 DUF2179 domain-containing protein [Mycoplasma tauri]MBZ4204026.1 DUF2179 domain-containing protein [Mycoplasma tauri]QSB07497.1 YitT family protein [Mycoplasma tauri]